MELQNIRDPRRATASDDSVDITVDVDGIGAGLPYTVPKGQDPLYSDIISGKYGAVKSFVPPTIDYSAMISLVARHVIEGPYAEKRESVNNYLGQLAAEKAGGNITADHQKDLDALLAGSAWEQSVLDKRDALLKKPDAAALAQAREPATWPTFPAQTAAVVAVC